MNGMIYVVLGHATFGLVVENSIVVDTPPYARRYLGADAIHAWRDLRARAVELRWIPI